MGEALPVCANCGQVICHPPKGSYPPEVKWVHVYSRMGRGNRFCGIGEMVAQIARNGAVMNDPLCPFHHGPGLNCQTCEYMAMARADERQRCSQQLVEVYSRVRDVANAAA